MDSLFILWPIQDDNLAIFCLIKLEIWSALFQTVNNYLAIFYCFIDHINQKIFYLMI